MEAGLLRQDWVFFDACTTSKLCELKKTLKKKQLYSLYMNPSDLVEVHKFSQVNSLKFQPNTYDCDQDHQSARQY